MTHSQESWEVKWNRGVWFNCCNASVSARNSYTLTEAARVGEPVWGRLNRCERWRRLKAGWPTWCSRNTQSITAHTHHAAAGRQSEVPSARGATETSVSAKGRGVENAGWASHSCTSKRGSLLSRPTQLLSHVDLVQKRTRIKPRPRLWSALWMTGCSSCQFPSAPAFTSVPCGNTSRFDFFLEGNQQHVWLQKYMLEWHAWLATSPLLPTGSWCTDDARALLSYICHKGNVGTVAIMGMTRILSMRRWAWFLGCQSFNITVFNFDGRKLDHCDNVHN